MSFGPTYPGLLFIISVGGDGLGQMRHFVEDDGYNMFRLPVGWQYLTYSQMTGVLNETQFTNYNMLVEACLSTGAYCEIDIHNYARYDGKAGLDFTVMAPGLTRPYH